MLARCALGLMAAVLSATILSSCAQSPNLPQEEVSCAASPTEAASLSRDAAELEFERTLQDLAQQYRFNEIYKLLLPDAQRGDPWTQYTVGELLLSGLVDGALVEGVPPGERDRTGIIWLRRAAYHCWESSIGGMSLFYKFGHRIMPKDAEISECFTRARKDVTHLPECQQMEIEKGYVKQR